MENRFSLPIDPYLSQIVESFHHSPNLILTAPPGSGKTLRVPAALLKSFIENNVQRKIIVLVPKRIAAVSAANFIAEENSWILGKEVGYQVRFDNKTTPATQLIFMTEGVFIKKVNDPELWKNLELIIFDEFHERSSASDMALGICYERQVLEQNLKILVMSATLDVAPLEKYLEDSQWIDVDSPPHPLQIIKNKKSHRINFDFTFVDQIVDTLREALRKSKKDVLVFLPGLHEIRMVQNRLLQTGIQTQTEILHGSIRLDEQRRILQSANHRRIILSTNIAESSLTLPSVDCVVDSGLQKNSVTESKIGFKRLELNRISHFSATQRAGRAARLGPGTCFQMWHEIDERSMPAQIEPEILLSDLLEESLTLLSMGVEKPETFSWLDQPRKSFAVAVKKLKSWQLITDDRKVTEKGFLVQRSPLDIERSVLFVELSQRGFQGQASQFLAFLETNDFSKGVHSLDIDALPLNEMGKKIERQLSGLSIKSVKSEVSFRSALIQVFLKYFPEKMAQHKEGLSGLSSLGRGIEFAASLVSKEYDYYLLFHGRDTSDSVTKIDFALGFSQAEFERYSSGNQTMQVSYQVDFEKNNIYKIEKRMSGLFVLSESSRIPLNLKLDSGVFINLFLEQKDLFLESHPGWKRYVTRISFLKKKASDLGYSASSFTFLDQLADKVVESIADTLASLKEFTNYDLYQLLIYLTPDEIKSDLSQMPSEFTLPNKKIVTIDYESELAPLISVRIQDVLGQLKNPTILNGKLRMTIELLAPNRRPTQITSQLEQFWLSSYFEIRKELRSRYPKHDWPEKPLEWKPVPWVPYVRKK
ncbi:MAG: DEAD/DEAH box helicase [Bdellovibrio sp.]|nr:DEAD/DEAH box helicase [Bdellovibrio sp.]